MSKVDFKLNDSLVRRRERGQHPDEHHPAEPDALEHEARATAETASEVAAPVTGAPDVVAGRLTVRARRPTVQTSILLPSFVWDRLDRLAAEAAGLTTPTRLLIDVLAGGPESVAEAAEELERFLALPPEDSGLGEPWEERNLRLPVELRRRLDGHRRALADAGVRHATRAHLVAATILARAPTTGDEARAMMAERRAEAFQRAIETTATPTGRPRRRRLTDSRRNRWADGDRANAIANARPVVGDRDRVDVSVSAPRQRVVQPPTLRFQACEHSLHLVLRARPTRLRPASTSQWRV